MQSAILAVRARVFADIITATGDPDHAAPGRDAADAELRLATRHHRAWQQLDALSAHAVLDHAERIDHGWLPKRMNCISG